MSVLHANYRRAGNCSGLLSDTVLLMSIDRIPAIRNHCSCFNYLISGVKDSQSEFLIHASLHNRFQFLRIRHRYLLMNFNVIQFYYGFKLIRLAYSLFVQTFQDVIRWDLGH